MPTKKKTVTAKTAKKSVDKPKAPKVHKEEPHKRVQTAAGWKNMMKKKLKEKKK